VITSTVPRLLPTIHKQSARPHAPHRGDETPPSLGSVTALHAGKPTTVSKSNQLHALPHIVVVYLDNKMYHSNGSQLRYMVS